MRADEIFSEVTAVYDNYGNALETGSVEALRAYARDLSERIVPRGVETDEVRAGDRVRSMRSWLVASLGAPGGKDVGLIQAFDKRDGEFTHLDEEVLVQLAQMAAAAVERAQRYSRGPGT